MATREAAFVVQQAAGGKPLADLVVTFDDQTLAVSGVAGTVQGATVTSLSNYLSPTNRLEVIGTRPGASGTLFTVNFDNVSVAAGGVDYNFVGKFAGPNATGNYATVTASNGTTYEAITPSPPSYSVSNICFTSGTLIATSLGDVAVERLSVGAIAITASGRLRTIRWIGHRDLNNHGAVLPASCLPVRISAGAFGHGVPARALSLSPGHPVLVGADADNEGGVLVPVMCLINGTTITREPVSSVTYWHVELDGHDILLAEGLPAESYIDGGDRAFFSEASDHALHNPDFMIPGWDRRCRPVVVDGPIVEAERARLNAVFVDFLADQCAWNGSTNFIAAH